MCLLFVAWRQHCRYPLIVAANRDEYHARASAPLAAWTDGSGLLAGRDLEAGGTWLGVDGGGRFAALTNFRDAAARPPGMRSRGELASGFLAGHASAGAFCRQALAAGGQYAGFNLFACDGVHAAADLAWCSNRGDGARALPAGVYGLSNHLLDTPWPKVVRGKTRLAKLLRETEPDEQALFAMLVDRRLPPDHELPDTGVGVARERALGAAFIVDPGYGTRASTLVFVAGDGRGRIIERSFAADGSMSGDVRLAFAG